MSLETKFVTPNVFAATRYLLLAFITVTIFGNHAVCVRDLDKLNLIWGFDPRLENPPKNTSHLKVFRSDPEKNLLAFYSKVKSKYLIHAIGFLSFLSVLYFVVRGLCRDLN